MKKITLILTSLILAYSCSNSDDPSDSNSEPGPTEDLKKLESVTFYDNNDNPEFQYRFYYDSQNRIKSYVFEETNFKRDSSVFSYSGNSLTKNRIEKFRFYQNQEDIKYTYNCSLSDNQFEIIPFEAVNLITGTNIALPRKVVVYFSNQDHVNKISLFNSETDALSFEEEIFYNSNQDVVRSTFNNLHDPMFEVLYLDFDTDKKRDQLLMYPVLETVEFIYGTHLNLGINNPIQDDYRSFDISYDNDGYITQIDGAVYEYY